MAKESSIDKIKRLVSNQETIRNIATSAHIHHGKCVSGGSRLILADGSVKTAREIFEEISNNGEIYEENEEYTVFSPNKKIEVYSLNKETGKLEIKRLQHAWRLVGGNTIKINLRNGFEITTTPEHKYIVFDNGLKEKESRNLKLGDRIVCSRKLNVKSGINIKKEILLKLSEKNFYINLKKEFHQELKEKILNYGIKNLKISLKPRSFYHGIWKNRYNLKDLVNLSGEFGISLNDLYDQTEKIYFRTGKQRGQNSLPMGLPENFEEFFYLAGLFIGDGSGKKFIAGKKYLADNMQKICRKIKIKTRNVERKDRTPEVHTTQTFAEILNSLFDYPLKRKSHNVKISDFVMRSNSGFVASLLRGYFDTDGSVEKSRSAVTISSASEKMIDDLHLLLLRFGCVAIKEKDQSLSISGISAINFEKNIGFGLPEKAEKLRILTARVSGSIVCDTIKVGDQTMLINKKLSDYSGDELAYIEIKGIESGFEEIVYDFTVPENHNFIAEGMVIHNTAFTDNLLAAAGMMASKNAGSLDEGMATWQHADEQERLMTVDSANVSMAHEYQGKEYLINLIDTPGHIDFGGNVTRAMRAIDGTFVLICAVEGIMPQTETVLRQALRERVKPILFINKVDRLIKEVKLSPEEMQKRFVKLIDDFNLLIEQIAEKEYKEKWKVNVSDGSVAFGSARENWALSIPFMKKKGISFKDIYKIYEMDDDDRKKWTWENAPLYEVILDMAVKHLPNPVDAQKYRIPKIWRGDLDSDFGKSLVNCNPKGEVAFVITRIVIDPRSGKEISAGRLYSGTIKNGMDVYCNMAKSKGKIQQVLVYNGIKPEQLESVPAGNVLAISGLNVDVGETITVNEQTPFDEIKHLFQPVITKSIEVVKTADLPKLIEILRQVSKEDPSVKVEINEQTGESLISGMGELHLEIIENRIKTEKGLHVKTSAPIIVYRETVGKESKPVEGRSPNKHNSFFIKVEPLADEIYNAIENNEIPEGRVKKRSEEMYNKLTQFGWRGDEIRNVKDIYKGNMFLDETRGEVHIGEILGMVMDAFEMVVNQGPLAREPCTKMKVSLVDTKLHEDAIHRGPAQVYPAVREAITDAMKSAGAFILEPLQIHVIDIPESFLGEITKLVGGKRGQMLDVKHEGGAVEVKAKIPVAEMIGWSNDLRSATEGRGVSSLLDQLFERIPHGLQEDVIRKIRDRKGLAENQ
ncbi:elongation factor EF-2 [Candidatus Pacearchaeota archaeon CG10_big_fil_rev_8_21_14_0_10_34_12]|nr:MAG: elongation factor EF-2 [Candidatus Pacearchaeota archaeon CG10_big_fil_rev_8_21_14_0_10_34_12]